MGQDAEIRIQLKFVGGSEYLGQLAGNAALEKGAALFVLFNDFRELHFAVLFLFFFVFFETQ